VWGMGTLAASASVIDEITDRTWDQQRMSAMQPWAMTWGKLGGASAYAWYGGALCLLFAVPAATHTHRFDLVVQLAMLGVLIGLGLQALAIAINLQMAKTGEPVKRRASLWVLVFLLFWVFVPLLQRVTSNEEVTWWGETFNVLAFGLASAALFAICAVLAAWRSMAEILKVRQMPWGWPGLAMLFAVYLSGFAPTHRVASVGIAGLLACSTLTFAVLLTEPQTRPVLQRLMLSLRAGQWGNALLQMPRWPTTLLLAFPFAVLATLSLSNPDGPFLQLPGYAGFNPLALALLLVRDCAVALFFALAVKNRRAVASFLFAMLVLYGVLPWLVGALRGDMLLSLLQPLAAKPGLSIVLAALHAAAAVALLVWRWRATDPERGLNVLNQKNP
jgi:hypothetical protein